MAETSPIEESILHSIRKNGFPEKVVRLPFKPVFDSSKKYGIALKQVLDNLKKQQIFGEISGDHIEFRSPEKLQEKMRTREMPPQNPLSWMSGFNNPEDMQKAAGEYLSKLTPEQIAEMREMAESMSDEDKENILKMISQQFKPGT